TSQDASIRHTGPMAQDVHAAVALGEASLRINTPDIDGAILAGVQALARRTAALRTDAGLLLAAPSARHAGLSPHDRRPGAVQATAGTLRAQQAADRAALEARLSRLEAALPPAAAPADSD